MPFDTLEQTETQIRELTVSEMDDVNGAGFWAVAAFVAPVAITVGLAYGAWHYNRGSNQGRRDNNTHGCRA